MTNSSRSGRPLHDDDEELASRIAQALPVAPATPAERARLAARVRARLASPPGLRRWPLAVLGGIGAATAVLLALALRVAQLPASEGEESALADESSLTEDSWQDQVLYAPEWIESRIGFVDAALLPESYAVASALLEP